MNQDELEAKLHREREAKRLLQLFQAENGREPRDEEDLNSWAASPKARGLIHGQLDEKGKVDPSYPNATLVAFAEDAERSRASRTPGRERASRGHRRGGRSRDERQAQLRRNGRTLDEITEEQAMG